MSRLLHLPGWVYSAAILLACAAFFRFALEGYDYIGHTCTLAALLVALHHFLGKGLWRAVVVLMCIGILYFIAVEVPIVKNSRTDKDAGRDYLVVLGAGVRGDVPSRALLYRLQATEKYLRQYPDSVAIVSGGQGEGENITEAKCMSDWLVEKGISPERIIMEDKATSTNENLQYSFDIIRGLGEDPNGNTAIVSSSYHLYRAKTMAKKQGVTAAGVSAYPGWALLSANYYIREAFGVTYLWVFG